MASYCTLIPADGPCVRILIPLPKNYKRKKKKKEYIKKEIHKLLGTDN